MSCEPGLEEGNAATVFSASIDEVQGGLEKGHAATFVSFASGEQV